MEIYNQVMVVKVQRFKEATISTKSSGSLSKLPNLVRTYNYAMAMMKTSSPSLLLLMLIELKSSL